MHWVALIHTTNWQTCSLHIHNLEACIRNSQQEHSNASKITLKMHFSFDLLKGTLHQPFEYLSSRRWLRKLCLFYKIVVNKSPNYLYNYVSTVNQSYQSRSGDKFLHMRCRTEYFANSFFPYTIKEWNNVSPEFRKSVSYEVFKYSLLKFIRPSPNSLLNVSDSLRIKLLTRLRLGLSHLREHKFNHNFQDTINPLCPCSLESESTTHFFLRCQNFTDLRKCLMNELIKTDSCIRKLDEVFHEIASIWR